MSNDEYVKKILILLFILYAAIINLKHDIFEIVNLKYAFFNH